MASKVAGSPRDMVQQPLVKKGHAPCVPNVCALVMARGGGGDMAPTTTRVEEASEEEVPSKITVLPKSRSSSRWAWRCRSTTTQCSVHANSVNNGAGQLAGASSRRCRRRPAGRPVGAACPAHPRERPLPTVVGRRRTPGAGRLCRRSRAAFVGHEKTLAHLRARGHCARRAGRGVIGAASTRPPGKSTLCVRTAPPAARRARRLSAHAVEPSPAGALVDGMLWVEGLSLPWASRRRTPRGPRHPRWRERVFPRSSPGMPCAAAWCCCWSGADQFDDGTRGRLHTWLPRPWPAKHCGWDGRPGAALAQHPGMQSTALPPLDPGEARHIAKPSARATTARWSPRWLPPWVAVFR